jgi:hypothetical protein
VGSMCLTVRVLLSAVFEGVVWHDISREVMLVWYPQFRLR